MFVAGIDIGSATSKAVILNRDRMVGHSLLDTGARSTAAAQRAMEVALGEAGLSWGEVAYVVATGYGRIIVPFANDIVTELSCHARGAHFLFPSARTILDMGGQDCKAIRCDDRGKLRNFAMNDKCAAGTGRFLEVLAKVMEVALAEMGPLALEAQAPVKINSTCTVFAQTEVASLLRTGHDRRDILAGLHEAITKRTFTLLRRVGLEADFVITGGIARNIAMVRKLEERAGLPALIPPEPQIVGALGAALFARDRMNSHS